MEHPKWGYACTEKMQFFTAGKNIRRDERHMEAALDGVSSFRESTVRRQMKLRASTSKIPLLGNND